MKCAATVFGAMMVCSAAAWGDGVSVVRGQFTDRVEAGRPQGDAAAAAHGRDMVFWMEVANRGAPAEVTVVWSVDGHEVHRQQLEVGHAPRWRTWASLHHRAGDVSVQVLDASGAPLHAAHLGG